MSQNKKTSRKSSRKTSNKKTEKKTDKKSSRKTEKKTEKKTSKKTQKNMKGGNCIINPIFNYFVNINEPCPLNNGSHINTQKCIDYRNNNYNYNDNDKRGVDKNCDLCGFEIVTNRNIIHCPGPTLNQSREIDNSMYAAETKRSGIRNHAYIEMTTNSYQVKDRKINTIFDIKSGKDITLHYCTICNYILPPEYIK